MCYSSNFGVSLSGIALEKMSYNWPPPKFIADFTGLVACFSADRKVCCCCMNLLVLFQFLVSVHSAHTLSISKRHKLPLCQRVSVRLSFYRYDKILCSKSSETLTVCSLSLLSFVLQCRSKTKTLLLRYKVKLYHDIQV